MTLWLATSPERFLQVFNRLAIALREKDTDAATVQVYFDSLFDLPLESLEESAAQLMRDSGRKWFPTTAEWREVAEKCTRIVLRKALPAPDRPEWRFDCLACYDTGWEYFSCDGSDGDALSACARQMQHYAHDFVKICPCRPTNRTWLRHNSFGAGTA